MSAQDPRHVIQTIYRIESPKLIARLARIVRDVGLAEELAQDALVAAIETWTVSGVPENPGAWLMTTARHRAINEFHRKKRVDKKHDDLQRDLTEEEQRNPAAAIDEAIDDPVGDDLLRLVFVACHPVLSSEARVALTLRLLGGLTTNEIARAFLVPEPTIAQRIVRAKRTLAEANVPFEVPSSAELGERLASVLDVLYLVFNEGYSATAGDDLIRPSLCEEAVRLARVLAGLVPDEPEVHGLVALMELHASRTPARVDSKGQPVLLTEQNRSLWDRLLVRRGLEGLARASAIASARKTDLGPYALQAAISACHARARTAAETDWSRIAELYGALFALTRSPVVELNRAVAVAMAEGPTAGLRILDDLRAAGTLATYHLLPAARGDLLEKLGRGAEAKAEFERAASLTQNERERELLQRRAANAVDRVKPPSLRSRD